MKQSTIFVLLLFATATLFAQRKADIGLTGGTCYYQGDINPNRLFYKPRYDIGPIVRLNINKRYSVRFQAIYARLAGSDNDFDRLVTKRRYPVTFNVSLINLGSQVEYNFFNFKTGINDGKVTPYLFGGIGYSIILNPVASGTARHVSMPFGVGTKANVTRRLSAGLEWSYNKAFNDGLDGVIWPGNGSALYHNDWYSFFNILITYKFFKFAADCPAYETKKKK